MIIINLNKTNMKKKYIAPAMEIEIMEMETLMAASPTDKMTIDPGYPGTNVVGAKGGASFSVWGDDDEE